jgi:hypothetical protein
VEIHGFPYEVIEYGEIPTSRQSPSFRIAKVSDSGGWTGDFEGFPVFHQISNLGWSLHPRIFPVDNHDHPSVTGGIHNPYKPPRTFKETSKTMGSLPIATSITTIYHPKRSGAAIRGLWLLVNEPGEGPLAEQTAREARECGNRSKHVKTCCFFAFWVDNII